MSQHRLHLKTVVSAPFGQNAFVAHLDDRDDCVVFDPGFETAELVEYIESHGLHPAAIIDTHGHADHIAGNQAIKRHWPDCPLVIGEGDAPKLTSAELNLSAAFGFPITSPPADLLLVDGQHYEVAGFDFEVWEISGHSEGHVVLIWKGHQPYVVFGGDILFAGGVGRVDFPGGSAAQLKAGIERHLFPLPDDTVVLPGHGPETTIGRERRSNPFVGENAAVRFG